MEGLAFERLQALLHREGEYYDWPAPAMQAGGDSPARPFETTCKYGSNKTLSSTTGRYITSLSESRIKIASWAYDGKFRFPHASCAVSVRMMPPSLIICQPTISIFNTHTREHSGRSL
jgi:hypothetical protein